MLSLSFCNLLTMSQLIGQKALPAPPHKLLVMINLREPLNHLRCMKTAYGK